MLRGLRLRPYKVHRELSIGDLPSLALIVGPNNSGKSAILHAAALPDYGVRWDPTLPTAPLDDPRESGDPIAVVEWEFEDEDQPAACRFTAREGGSLSWALSYAGQTTSHSVQVPQPDEGRGTSNLGFPSNRPGRTFFLGAHRPPPGRSFAYRPFSRDIGPSGTDCWNVVHQLKANDSPKFVEVSDAMRSLGFGIQQLRTPTASAGAGSIWVQNYGRADSLPNLGSGTAGVLPVITQGVLCEPGETLLLEEPESHLHQGALDALGRFFGGLASKGVQVFAATHSTALFGSLYRGMQAGVVPRDASVLLLDRAGDGRTSVVKLGIDDYYRTLNASDSSLRR